MERLMELRRIFRPWAASLAILAAGFASGCGRSTFPVEGVVTVAGDVSALEGSVIEIAVDGDPLRRASGEIQADGGFTLTTLHDGRLLTGAKEGVYKVRIIPNDDDRQTRRRALAAIHARYLKFQTSDVTLTVPATETVAIVLKGGKS